MKKICDEEILDDLNWSYKSWLVKTADFFIENNEVKKALDVIKKIDTKDTTYEFNNLALKLLEHGETEIAVKIVMEDKSCVPSKKFIDKLCEIGEMEKAFNCLKSIDPDYVFSAFEYFFGNEFVSLEVIKKFDEETPDYAKLELALEYAKRGELERAVEISNIFEDGSWEHIKCLCAIALHGARSKKIYNVETIINRILKNNYFDEEIILNLSETYILLGKKDKAVKILEKKLTENSFFLSASLKSILEFEKICPQEIFDQKWQTIFYNFARVGFDIVDFLNLAAAFRKKNKMKYAEYIITSLIDFIKNKDNDIHIRNLQSDYLAKLLVKFDFDIKSV